MYATVSNEVLHPSCSFTHHEQRSIALERCAKLTSLKPAEGSFVKGMEAKTRSGSEAAISSMSTGSSRLPAFGGGELVAGAIIYCVVSTD